MQFDLNCDLGEGEAPARTRALMKYITSANIACGGHAGDVTTMRRCVRLALASKVRIGAHPGPWSRGDFGRGAFAVTEAELELLLLQQVGALERITRSEKSRLHHIKLHGALYHATEREPKLAAAYLKAVRDWWPHLIVYAQANGTVAGLARRARVEVWREAFLDRSYRDDGSLVPRGEPGALVTRLSDVLDRIRSLTLQKAVNTASGKVLRLHARTICIHSDTPNAPRIARMARAVQVE
jgi:5-oxoprolinase (ATP-hydrolysing) subunit A